MLSKEIKKLQKEFNIKYIVYWGKNGKKYVINANKKLTNHQEQLHVDQVCDDCVWCY